jgi:hypothetical protein
VPLSKRIKTKTHMAFLLAKPTPRNVNHDNDRFSMFNKERDIPHISRVCGPVDHGRLRALYASQNYNHYDQRF